MPPEPTRRLSRFVTWYPTEEDAEDRGDGICGGDSFKKDVSKDTVTRLMAQSHCTECQARLKAIRNRGSLQP
jgi:hypothetical protein